ncbi:MAG: nitroreductase family protein [Verrucomicrobiota bacterium JB025]|nr:nitroreductase family protein [Verrucomicrobiota bacterium JB025]
MKTFIKTRLPFILPVFLIPEVIAEYFRYIRYSGMTGGTSRNKLLGRIIASYHVVEKGLTMPETRLGFGVPLVRSLVKQCTLFQQKYGNSDDQWRQAVAVLKEYIQFHDERNHSIEPEIISSIRNLAEITPAPAAEQIKYSSVNYFAHIADPFESFSASRKSVRNYSSKEVPVELLREAVALATSSPSSCNRQGSRVHVISDTKTMQSTLAIQAGNRGFGHLANKLLIVTGELGATHNVFERHMPYVDGGMFAMNLLYALHRKGIAACPLNCYLAGAKLAQIRQLCAIPDSESPIVMISCGYPPDDFLVARSSRMPADDVITVHQPE